MDKIGVILELFFCKIFFFVFELRLAICFLREKIKIHKNAAILIFILIFIFIVTIKTITKPWRILN